MTILELHGGDRLILHGLSAPGSERGSILRLRPTGGLVWTAHPPKGVGQDAFVSMQLQDGALLADTFQGLRLRIDLDTGLVRSSTFVK